MRYKCCRYLHNGISFQLNEIRPCNNVNYGVILYDSKTEGSDVDVEKVFERRKAYIEKCKNGEYFEPCVNCSNFVEDEWDDNININYLCLFHWIHCNCACVYCFQEDERKALVGGYSSNVEKSQYYDAYPIIKYMAENNMLIIDKLHVEFGGGEPTILKELPDILSLINEIGYNSAYIMSSGILYSKDIEKYLQHDKSFFSVTIAAGTREIFKKIKRRDKFDVVKNNLIKYLKNTPYPQNIFVRYLIYEGINDTEKDIKDWIDLCEEIGAKRIEITFEFCKSITQRAGKPYSKHLDNLIDFYKKYTEEKGIFEASIDYVTKEIIKRGHY